MEFVLLAAAIGAAMFAARQCANAAIDGVGKGVIRTGQMIDASFNAQGNRILELDARIEELERRLDRLAAGQEAAVASEVSQ